MTILAPLKRLRWALARASPNAHEADVASVVDALARGDELLARRLAAVVDEYHSRRAVAAHRDVRAYWLAELAQWDGRSPPAAEMAAAFASDMAEALERLRGPAGHEAEAIYFATTPARVERVALAFARAQASKWYERNPGRTLMSAGLRALGVDAREVDRLLDFHRKT